jgi:hypothetical protein
MTMNRSKQYERGIEETCTMEDVLSLLGQFLLTSEGAISTCRAVASAHTVAVDAVVLLQQTIITLCSRARRRDVTIHRLPMRRARCYDAPSR